MRRHSRTRLLVETLENRLVPALTLVALDASGDLLIQGVPNSTLSLNYSGSNVTVMDGATPYGPFAVSGYVKATLGNDARRQDPCR